MMNTKFLMGLIVVVGTLNVANVLGQEVTVTKKNIPTTKAKNLSDAGMTATQSDIAPAQADMIKTSANAESMRSAIQVQTENSAEHMELKAICTNLDRKYIQKAYELEKLKEFSKAFNANHAAIQRKIDQIVYGAKNSNGESKIPASDCKIINLEQASHINQNVDEVGLDCLDVAVEDCGDLMQSKREQANQQKKSQYDGTHAPVVKHRPYVPAEATDSQVSATDPGQAPVSTAPTTKKGQ